MADAENLETLHGIAVIGMAGKFPGASNIDEFWKNLFDNIESINRFSDDEIDSSIEKNEIHSSNYVKSHGILDHADKFDAPFFGMNTLEAEIMDPQQRIFLELSWHALEHAGYDSEQYDGLVGVFAGKTNNTYYHKNVQLSPEKLSDIGEFQAMCMNEKDYLSPFISYKLNLTGPSLSIHTACSTSLVAISTACDNLNNYQCDMALAGGVSITFPQKRGYLYSDMNIFSKDGHCRPFDSEANGTVFSDGAGVIVLKRVEDAIEDGDSIYAVIKGNSVNNDGANKMTFTAPSVYGQSENIAMALANSEINPEKISYIETHGTATRIGDPIEVEALAKVYNLKSFGSGKCGIGSLKSNLGHLDVAAGIAGVLKVILSMKNGIIPATLHFKTPNPNIDFSETPFYVVDKNTNWNEITSVKKAAVNSLGVGGTNAHVILEEPPKSFTEPSNKPFHLIVLSAKTESALEKILNSYIDNQESLSQLNIADISYTLTFGRRPFKYRKVVVCKDSEDLISTLKESKSQFVNSNVVLSKNPEITFMFPGQGAHYIKMGMDLYKSEAFFKNTFDKCCEILTPLLSLNLRDILFGIESNEDSEKKLKQTKINQPAMFVIEYSLSKLFMNWGVTPSSMIGHSIGEYTAACLAGVFNLEDALKLVAKRGELMQSVTEGKMLSVMLPKDKVEELVDDQLSIAAINAPNLCVVAGKSEDINSFHDELKQKNIICKSLETSHAFHSHMMEPILDSFHDVVKSVDLSRPDIPFISCVSGSWILPEEASDPKYWVKHLRNCVQFSEGVEKLLEDENRILLEVGPRKVCSSMVRMHAEKKRKQIIIPSLDLVKEYSSEMQNVLFALGKLWAVGVKVDWSRLYVNEKRQRVPLPVYHFDHRRYWIAPSLSMMRRNEDKLISNVENKIISNASELNIENDSNDESVTNTEAILMNIWKKVIPEIKKISLSDNFFDIGGDSLLAVQVFSEIQKITKQNLPISLLIDFPVLADLARELEQSFIIPNGKDKIERWRSLVSIKPEGKKTPFFCVHGIGGNVLNYSQLTEYIDQEQPLYGLQARGLDGELKPFDSIEDMAKEYVKEVRSVQKKGPYKIGGGSMGGLVAFEMAQQLLKQGEEIEKLIMFDTFGPASTEFQEVSNGDSSIAARLSDKIKNIKSFDNIVPSLKYSLVRKINNVITKTLLKFDRPLPHYLRYKYIEKHHMALISKYKATSYDGDIILFRAVPEDNLEEIDMQNGWGGYINGNILAIPINGIHELLVESTELKRKLEELL